MEPTRDKTQIWVKAMEAAATEHLQAERITDTLYAVRSTSRRGYKHLVHINPQGKIDNCSDCEGWRRCTLGQSRPCKHAGAVARRLLRERHIAIETPTVDDYQMPESGATKRTVFRSDAA